MPDLDLIKQAEQGVRDGRGRISRSRWPATPTPNPSTSRGRGDGGRRVAFGASPRPSNIDIIIPRAQHQDMRTTLTLDDDVAAKLKAEARRAGRSFREIVNDALRRGLASQRVTAKRRSFKITARTGRSEAGAFPGQCRGAHRARRRPALPSILVDANLLLMPTIREPSSTKKWPSLARSRAVGA